MPTPTSPFAPNIFALRRRTLASTCSRAQVPSFALQGRLLEAVGTDGMLHIVLAAYVLRMLCYSLLPLAGSPWAVLPVEALHGITFACSWGVGTINCRRLAPPGLEATMQGIFQVCVCARVVCVLADWHTCVGVGRSWAAGTTAAAGRPPFIPSSHVLPDLSMACAWLRASVTETSSVGM